MIIFEVYNVDNPEDESILCATREIAEKWLKSCTGQSAETGWGKEEYAIKERLCYTETIA